MKILPRFKMYLLSKLGRVAVPITWLIDIILGFFIIFVTVGVIYLSYNLWNLII